MSGIMTAIVGTVAPNIIYGAGLWNTTTGVDLSPITASAINTSISRTWIGYFTPASTATVTLSLQTTADAGSAGGSASTTGQLWIGSAAISGSGGANITAFNNQFVSTDVPMTQGVYYPIRIQWDGSYEDGFFGDDSSGSITFYASVSTDVSGRIFYNTLTNGF